MNIVTMIRIEDGLEFQGFLDWDGMTRQMNFYYWDEGKKGWLSDKLGKFKPVPKTRPPSVLTETVVVADNGGAE